MVKLTDFIAPLVPLGLGFGRIGNFINQELWGRPTDLPWGMVFPVLDEIARHPSQFYQALFEGLFLFLILYLYSNKKRPTGSISALFLIFYGLFRFLVEFTREPDSFFGSSLSKPIYGSMAYYSNDWNWYFNVYYYQQ